jgi:hypothetical protein
MNNMHIPIISITTSFIYDIFHPHQCTKSMMAMMASANDEDGILLTSNKL